MKTRQGESLFLKVDVGDETVRVFGRPDELAERLEATGYDIPASEIEAGMELHPPCLVRVISQGNNGYKTIEEFSPDPKRLGRVNADRGDAVLAGSLDCERRDLLREASGQDSPQIDKEHQQEKTGEKIFRNTTRAERRGSRTAGSVAHSIPGSRAAGRQVRFSGRGHRAAAFSDGSPLA
jgi:hypothetical protein